MSSSTAQPSPSYEQRVLGSVLGAMCGDVLGAAVEGWTPERMESAFPDGLKTFQETEPG
jgi:ADP-ribosylglycohydrolase